MSNNAGGLEVSYDGAVARLVLSRPERLNALNEGVRKALAQVLSELEDRPDIRVVVLEGSGNSFSAGADLKTTAYPDLSTADWPTRRHRAGTWQRVLDQLGRIPQVTVARLQGHVIGGAALLAVACDLRVAADDVVVRIPELAIGIPLTWAGIPLLVREIGLPLTRDWVMTCREVRSDELLRCGFAQRVVARTDLDRSVADCVNQLLAVPPGPLAMTRAMTSALGRSSPAMAASWGDPDHQQWSFTEQEYRDAVIAYVREMRNRSTKEHTAPLPDVISQYLALASVPDPGDADRIAACFSEDGHVTDEGEMRTGRDTLRQWWRGPATHYQYTVEVRGGHELGHGRFVVFTRLEGNFPGGVADLANRFTVADGLITELEIVLAQ